MRASLGQGPLVWCPEWDRTGTLPLAVGTCRVVVERGSTVLALTTYYYLLTTYLRLEHEVREEKVRLGEQIGFGFGCGLGLGFVPLLLRAWTGVRAAASLKGSGSGSRQRHGQPTLVSRLACTLTAPCRRGAAMPVSSASVRESCESSSSTEGTHALRNESIFAGRAKISSKHLCGVGDNTRTDALLNTFREHGPHVGLTHTSQGTVRRVSLNQGKYRVEGTCSVMFSTC